MSTHSVSEVFSPPSNFDEIPENPLFDDPDADIILRSCDHREFRVLKLYNQGLPRAPGGHPFRPEFTDCKDYSITSVCPAV